MRLVEDYASGAPLLTHAALLPRGNLLDIFEIFRGPIGAGRGPGEDRSSSAGFSAGTVTPCREVLLGDCA